MHVYPAGPITAMANYTKLYTIVYMTGFGHCLPFNGILFLYHWQVPWQKRQINLAHFDIQTAPNLKKNSLKFMLPYPFLY